MKRKNNKKINNKEDIILKIMFGLGLLTSLGLNIAQHYTIKEYKNLKDITPTPIVSETQSFTMEDNAQKVFDRVQNFSTNQYVIKKGDTLSEIVHSIYGKYDYNLLMNLAKHNNIKNVDKIIAGDVISIPSADELKKISVDNNTTKQISQSTFESVSELKDNVNTLNEDVNTLKNDMAEVQSDISVMKDDIKANAEKIEENTSDIATLKTETENTQNELKGVEKDISEIKTNVKANSDNIDLLATESNNTQIELNNVKADVSETKDNITNLQNDVERHDKNITNIDKKLDSHSKFENTEIQKINNRLETLESEMNSGKLSMREVLERLNAIENNLDKLSENQISKDAFMENISSENSISTEDTTEIKTEDDPIPEIEEAEVYDTPVIEDENEYEDVIEDISNPSYNTYMEDETDNQEPEITDVYDDTVKDDTNNIEDESFDIPDTSTEEIENIEVEPIRQNPMNFNEIQSIVFAKTR
ncbi:LysM peptidoglycan-binding domain-containing protein [bacterium]|nr:LysM peptidoglycan-binding domain-containing protein [bacterium]